MKGGQPKYLRGSLVGLGVILIVLGSLVLLMSLWEGFGGLRNRFITIELPGFHELDLKDAGLYGGVYQHQRPGPIPAKELTKMDVRIMAKRDYREVPVLMNTTGQTFDRLGMRGMPLFNFSIEEPGVYTISGVYLDIDTGPTVPVMIVAQAAQNIKQTLITGAIFFSLFVFLGILIFVKLNKWAPKPTP